LFEIVIAINQTALMLSGMKSIKTYRVEVLTTSDRSAGWRFFKTCTGKTKSEAIKSARRYNWDNCCLDRYTDGRISFRALEEAAT
jgi:hypothetical protein